MFRILPKLDRFYSRQINFGTTTAGFRVCHVIQITEQDLLGPLQRKNLNAAGKDLNLTGANKVGICTQIDMTDYIMVMHKPVDKMYKTDRLRDQCLHVIT